MNARYIVNIQIFFVNAFNEIHENSGSRIFTKKQIEQLIVLFMCWIAFFPLILVGDAILLILSSMIHSAIIVSQLI